MPVTPITPAQIDEVAKLTDEDLRRQVADQCRVVSSLARTIAKVHADYARLAGSPVFSDIAEQVGWRTSALMEVLGDVLNDMDATSDEDYWMASIFREAQRLFPTTEDWPMSDTTITPPTPDALAKLAEIPAGGWVLVPREPTRAMVDDGTAARGATGSLDGATNSRACYQAMIASAPAPDPTKEKSAAEWQQIAQRYYCALESIKALNTEQKSDKYKKDRAILIAASSLSGAVNASQI